MSDPDLDEIRAQLRANGASERKSPSRTLSSLIRGKPPAPLLGPPVRHAPPGAPTPPPSHDQPACEDQPLLLGGPLAPPVKRSAFGRRRPAEEAGPRPESAAVDEDADMTLSLRLPPPSPRRDESVEPPFLPGDLEDPRQGALELVPSDTEPVRGPGPAERVLLQLEKRLLEEHLGLIRTLAGA